MQKEKIKIMFICHGNICRSPMAEFVMKELVRQAGREEDFVIASSATSREELGNPVYPPAQRVLRAHNIPFERREARRFTAGEYEEWDLLICMDKNNLRNLSVITPDPDGKVRLLLDYAGRKGAEVADPWWTGNFDETWQDVLDGCRGLLDALS
ncbi:MAG: low molecular weight phosphotyrosine protein phosphatase [Lentisphaeria bacterium]|nr:low molecular weight phosphotyrosine protein phosphatase [Lentisphaeria bacterium]